LTPEGPAVPPAGPGPAGERGDRALIRSLLLLLAIAASATPIRNYDYWWHLATGRYILEHRAVPRVDPFSFTAGGAAWLDHEWLFQVLLYLGHTSLGPAALCLMKVGAVLLLGRMMAGHLRREGYGPAGAAVLLLPAFLGASFRLDVRPEMATLVLAPLALHCVLRARETGRAAPLAAVPLLVALGANLHPGILLVPAMLGGGWAASVILERFGSGQGAGAHSRLPGPPVFTRRLGAVAAASALAAGANPYGFGLYGVPLAISRVLASIPAQNLEWQRPAPGQFPLFWAAAAAAIAILVLGWRRADPLATPALLLALVLGSLHLRNLGIFFLLLPYGVARPGRAVAEALRRSWRRPRWAVGSGVRPGFIAATTLLAAGVPLLALLPPGVAWGLGVSSDNEPAAAADFLEREAIGRRLFNDVRFGGYLIWRRFPGHPVFIDGRNEIYGDLLREIFAAMRDPAAWAALLGRYDIDAAFLRYPPSLQRVLYPGREGGPPTAGERAFSAAYFPRPSWALVYWDDDAMIFLRRSQGHTAAIARLEYRSINPDDWRDQYAAVLAGRRPVGPILEEIRRKLAEDGSCRRAQTLLRIFSGLQADLGRGAGPGSGQGG